MATATQTKTEMQATERMGRRPMYAPRTDVYERRDALVIEAEMPGVSREGVEIELKDNELEIIGRRSNMPAESDRQIENEFTFCDYGRRFTVEGIDADKIDATMQHGILRIVLPKSRALQPRKIAVRKA
jgi:HSP20 family protein